MTTHKSILLRLLEKFPGIHLNKATFLDTIKIFSGQGAREGYLAAVDQGIISLSNFLATLLLARNVTATELGVYGVGFTSLRLLRAFQDGLTIQPLNTFGASLDENEFKQYASSTSLLQGLMAVMSAGGIALIGWILLATGNDTAGPGILSLWPAFLWWQLHEYIRRMLYTRGRIFEAAINSIFANLSRILILIWWIGKGTIQGTDGITAIALGSFIAIIPGLWQTRVYFTTQFKNIRSDWLKNWEYGRWLIGGAIANWIAIEFYPVLTAGMISFAAAGAYRALQNLVAPIHLLLRAIDTFLTPRASRSYYQNGFPGLQRSLKLIYSFSSLPILALLSIVIIFPKQLLSLLYGETYLEYSLALVLMAAFYALWFLYWPLQSVLKAAKLSRAIFLANLAAIAAMFTIGLWMISYWGVYGTIAGQALNAAIVAVILWTTWFLAMRHHPPKA